MHPGGREQEKCPRGGVLRIHLMKVRAGRSRLLPHFVCVFLGRIIPYIVDCGITNVLKKLYNH